ncbi:helix-turn-helix domain-containing protein [Vibrio penaeicida]|uniref:helix-turn-helix domain-containing protein n=1 Tax=Vibrio penaeicida TaxID=104609 RepID=UPI000CE9ED16|nr:helix-turn-helix domain-containing protein [Vibrio penaeicida]
MIYSPKQLAELMLLKRQKNGWTQSKLAKRVGIKQATISNFENNLSISLKNWIKTESVRLLYFLLDSITK